MLLETGRKPSLLLWSATLAIGLAFLFPAGAAKAANGTLSATYAISIAGIPIGKADATTRFEGTGYALSISGSTSGLSRLISDATAQMESAGRLYPSQLVSGSFNLDTRESGLNTRVRMKLSGGSVVQVSAIPPLMNKPTRVPITDAHKQNVVDPVSAFLVPAGGHPENGKAACARTLRVFDGWQRFDIRLFYKEDRKVETEAGGAKQVFVCGARYVPVSGHDSEGDGVRYMAENKNLEVWLTSIAELGVFIPYRIQIGTKVGELTIRATSISTGGTVTRASVQ